jgi:glycosyltransferase involved in cell wall biosynthesis
MGNRNINREGWLRVCNIIEEGRFGGPQARIVLVAEALKKYGVDTHVAYSRYDADKFSKKLAEKSVSSSALNIIRLSKERKVLIRYIFCFLPEVIRLYRFFRKENFDLVHVNGSYQFKGALAAKMAGIPVVWHLNDTGMITGIKKLCIFIAKYCASGFIVAGQRVYDYYIRGTAIDRKPCIEIHAPVDTVLFDPENVVTDKRLEEYDGLKILTVSNIQPAKGFEYFIEMASDLTQKYENLHCFIGGAVYSNQEKYYKSLKKLATSKGLVNLLFLGKLDDVASALKAADIYVFTSLAEASPIAVWEAMSMGKAIVANDVGSVRQYIEDGKSGFIVPIKDQQALNAKMEILLKDAPLRRQMGAEARAVAKERLDVSIAAEKHALFYRKILGMQKNGTAAA